ncbi:sulfite exporter TauE/SafE family protein [Armatimonas sp.]|uniref:sulfite exporter TauE/SafE family protein n=1 Tax=Armatimonas sp. TaxID=1872638 RepID=UPI00374DE605
MTSLQLGLVFVASFVAGGVNSVAGGGTLLTFPVLLSGGLDSIVANATNSAGLAPGALTSFLGYRKELVNLRHLMLPLALLALVGATAGALLLLATPTRIFDRLIPFLILAATLLFAFQDKLKKLNLSPQPPLPDVPTSLGKGGISVSVALYLLCVAVYGGYFGAGIGILTLAALGMLGMTDIHKMNGLKTVFTGGLNVVASVVLLLNGKVDLKIAALMTLGAMLGGWLGVGGARRLGASNVRKLVILIGIVLSVQTLLRYWVL